MALRLGDYVGGGYSPVSIGLHSWAGKEMTSLSPPPLRTGHAGHLAPGSSNRRTPRGALLL
jgi:hypothetical protein